MVGIDIVEVKRIKNLLKKEGFINKILTNNEIEYVKQFKNCDSHVAGFFACKEAVMKALKDCKQISFNQIEISHDEFGAPQVSLCGMASEVFKKSGFKLIDVSISQTNESAVAICFLK